MYVALVCDVVSTGSKSVVNPNGKSTFFSGDAFLFLLN